MRSSVVEQLDRLAKTVERLGKMEVVRDVLEWAVAHKEQIPQPAIDDLLAITDKHKNAAP